MCNANFNREFFDGNYYNRNFNGCGCNSFDDPLFREVERIAHRAACRRARENRCARQFVNCMRNVEGEFGCGCNTWGNWNSGCGCNRW